MWRSIRRYNRELFVFCLLSLALSAIAHGSAGGKPKRQQSNHAVIQADGQKSAALVGSKGTAAATPLAKDAARRLNMTNKIASQPLEFFPVAESTERARFVANGAGYSLTLGDARMVLTGQRPLKPIAGSEKPEPAGDGGVDGRKLSQQRFRTDSELVEFVGANRDAKVEGLNPSSVYANFMIGNDPAKWRSHVTGFNRVRYTSLYPGIDLVYHGELHHKLEYDLAVAPGADPEQIRLRISGDHEAQLGQDGDLELDGPEGAMRLDPPILYQNIPGGKKIIPGGFVQLASNEFGFRETDYDKSKPLIIDPTINLLYSTYAGGIHNDEAIDMTLDAAGNVYIAGWAASQDFPVTSNAYQQVRQNIGVYVYDAVVMKFDASGNVLFSTFLGGQQNDQGEGIRVDQNGLVYLAGYTQSSDFPVTGNALQKTWGGGLDAFFSVISNDGSQLIYSTYLGGAGDESIYRMVEDSSGAFWLAGGASAAGLPVTTGVYQPAPNGTDNGFVAKVEFNAANTQPLKIDALTFLGGSNSGEEGSIDDLSLDSTGNVYVTGFTESTDYPTTSNAYEKASAFTLSGGCYNSSNPNSIATVSELSPDLKSLIYSSVLGGKTEATNGGEPVCNQFGHTIHADGKGNIWVVGVTGMQDFPSTANAISKQLNGNGLDGVDLFVSELTPGQSSTVLTYSSYLGGSQWDFGSRAIWDANNDIWIIANSQSTDWPGIVQGTSLQAANGGGYDATITELQPDGTKILYATYLGGSGDEDADLARATLAMDANSNLYLAGGTGSTNFPVTTDAFQPTFANGETSPDGYDFYFVVLGTGTIGTVGPVIGGNTGDTTITVDGAGYESGATCSLVQGGTVIASAAATVNSSGTSISCTFALSGAATGSYDVVVNNPNGSSFTKSGGFTVQSGGQPDLSVSVVGRPIIRTGFPSTFYVNVTNSGSENAYFVPLWVTLPVGVSFAINGYTESESTFLSTNDGTTNYVSLVLGQIAPGQTTSIPLQITSATNSPGIAMSATLQPPWFGNAAEINAAMTSGTYFGECTPSLANSYANNCLGAYLISIDNGARLFSPTPNAVSSSTAFHAVSPNDTPCTTPPPPSAYDKGVTAGQNDAMNGTHTANPYWTIDLANWSNWGIGYAIGNPGSLNTGPAIGNPGGSKLRRSDLGNASPVLAARPQDGETCTVPPKPPPNLPPPATTNPPAGSSVDPNYKSGPSGDNSKSAYVRGSAALNYVVGFENEPTAAFPADQVVVTDQLDPAKVNLSTVTLGTISFGTTVITLPGGTTNYNTTYNINSGLSVRIQGSLNASTGLLKWAFISIDPSTGLPPTDPTVGFLPPDVNGIEGQGSVQFNVVPNSGQTTGTQITNMATVVFDTNAPINTPSWLNSLDVDAPVSTVTMLPAAEATTGSTDAFIVNWSGTDKGSGIGSYTIYVSDNGGAFTAWQSGVTTTSASYTGTLGHTYGFYSMATDGAGNVEAVKTGADTTTTVAPPTPLASSTRLTASSSSVAAGSSVTLTAVVAQPSGSIIVPTGTVNFLNGTTTLGTGTLDGTGTAAYTTTALPAGTDSITAQYGGGAIFSASTSAVVSVTVGTPNFSLALSSTSLSVTNGSSATTTITATPNFGFASAITFACSGLPEHSTCSFSPSSVTPAGGAAGTTTLTIATGVSSTAAIASVRQGTQAQGISGRWTAFLLLSLIFVPWGILNLHRIRTSNGLYRLLILLVATGIFAAVSGCGGGGKASNSTPSGTSTVTVKATSGSTTETTAIQLTVN
jgi:hypothetical protein